MYIYITFHSSLVTLIYIGVSESILDDLKQDSKPNDTETHGSNWYWTCLYSWMTQKQWDCNKSKSIGELNVPNWTSQLLGECITETLYIL